MFGAGLELANRFRLTRRLGGSDASPVWLATDREPGQVVVLKIGPRAAGAAGAPLIADDLRHAGIARALDRLQDGIHDIEVFDFAAQGDLGANRGRACATWLPQVRELAAALEYLHAHGLVHGDVKAGNVLVNSDGHALLADLDTLRPVGAARLDTDSYSPFTASPQQRAGAPAQPADDIYSFGALLYELLCAHPPGYVPGSAALPPTTLPPELLPVQPAPALLLQLTRSCLAPEVADRPVSMQQVAAELAALEPEVVATRAAVPLLTPPTSAANSIQPRWERGVRTEAPDTRALRRQGFRQGLLVAGVVALAALAVLLFAWPGQHARAPLAKAPPAASPAAAGSGTDAAGIEPTDLQALAAAKTDAESRREALAPRIEAMADADAASWNPAGLRAAQAALAAIDALIAQRDYQSASRQLATLAPSLAAMEAGRKPALLAALQRGQAALQQRNSAAAAVAFAQALKIEADSREAQRGAQRAANLDAVLVELARASALQQSGRLTEAAAAYRHVLALDAEAATAQTALARLQSQLAADQFGQALARGYTALGAGNRPAARTAFEAARAQRPNDPEVARALEQLAAAEQGSQLSSALANARQAESGELWLDATKYYLQALALDSTLVDARRSLANATARAQLDRELRSLIAQPERAYATAVHDAGVASLHRAQLISSPGPILQRQMTAVAMLLQKAEQPVSVALRSDGQTSVTVYKIAELGSFAERSLQLKPGRYVIAGTRSGYRDVRRELNVLPDRELTPLTVECTEPL